LTISAYFDTQVFVVFQVPPVHKGLQVQEVVEGRKVTKVIEVFQVKEDQLVLQVLEDLEDFQEEHFLVTDLCLLTL
jgi:hypothetical protein